MAFSRLRRVLGERGMTVLDLHGKLVEGGDPVNIKTLYQLAREGRPLGRLDIRVVETLCHRLDVPLGDIIDIRPVRLEHFPPQKQQRLDGLLELSNAGTLSTEDRRELETLVFEAQAVAHANAQALGEPTHKARGGRRKAEVRQTISAGVRSARAGKLVDGDEVFLQMEAEVDEGIRVQAIERTDRKQA